MKLSGILPLLACLLYFAPAKANVVVTGVFPGAAGEEVRLMEYMDLISYRPGEADARIIDADGSFRFEFYLDEPRLMFLRIMHGRNVFYATPGSEIHLSFDSLNLDQPALQRSFPVNIIHLDDTLWGLNRLIRRMDDMVADYLETYVAGNIRGDHRHSLQAFASGLEAVVEDAGNPFFETHARFYIAYLERTLNTKSFGTLVETCLIDQPIHYHHPMYMDFLQTMFDSYVFAGSPAFGFRDLQQAVNQQESYSSLMKTLGKDPVFRNAVFREVVMLLGLQKMMGMEGFDADKVLGILGQVRDQSKYSKHRLMAGNILEQQTALRPGFPAPVLSLHGDEQHGLSLQDYRGQYLYLFFWAGWCPVSMAETTPMTELAAGLSDEVALLGVLVDRDEKSIPDLPGKDDFRLVHFGGDYRLLDRYQVRTIPHYLLIDPQGRIAACPFTSPSGGAAGKIRELSGR